MTHLMTDSHFALLNKKNCSLCTHKIYLLCFRFNNLLKLLKIYI